jgi:ribonuclease III
MKFLKKIFKKSPRSNQDGLFFEKIKDILGFPPADVNNYTKAFTHRSSNKQDKEGNPISYERLEFLGDAMLSAVIAAHLFSEAPSGDEGYLTKMRSKIVSREHLNELGKDLKLIELLDSKTAPQHFGENIHGNVFEALVGAIYFDLGFSFCKKFIHEQVIDPYVDIAKLEGKVISYKSLLIEWCQKEKRYFRYEIFDDTGVQSERFFSVKLYIDNKVVAKARATSKKKAEEKASQRAYFAFQDKINKK